MADAIAREAVIEVALVLAPVLAERGEIGLNLGASNAKQRAHDADKVAATRLISIFHVPRGLRPGLSPSRRFAAWILAINIIDTGTEGLLLPISRLG